MSDAATKPMTLPEFLEWEDHQERKFEFVDGEPRMMTGGTQAHSLIGGNIYAALRTRLRGSNCRPYASDMRVPIPETGNSRYPDVTVDCGPYVPLSHDASTPTVVFEVLSKSTAWYDQSRKLRDYEKVGDIVQYVCVSQSGVRVSVWTRDASSRFVAEADMTDDNEELCIESIQLSLPVVGIYERTGLGAIAE